MEEIIVKGVGKTLEHNGEVILVSESLPPNCMVLFIDMETWQEIKEYIKVEDKR